MNDLVIAFLITVVLFVCGLIIKRLGGWKFCVLCVSVSGTWIALLFLSILGFYADSLIIGIYMGQSTVGLYYLLEKRFAERFGIFRLPYMLTGTVVVYSIVQSVDDSIVVPILLVLAIWIMFYCVYLMRTNKTMKKIAKHIIACCRDW